eukprot:1554148-Prymnesium_polylepis.1
MEAYSFLVRETCEPPQRRRACKRDPEKRDWEHRDQPSLPGSTGQRFYPLAPAWSKPVVMDSSIIATVAVVARVVAVVA